MIHNDYYNYAIKKHRIYPDEFNPMKEGTRAPYFYLHGKAMEIAMHDCFNVNDELMSVLLQRGVSIAMLDMCDSLHVCLVFCDFDSTLKRMTGYAVLIHDEEGIKDAVKMFPHAWSRVGGHHPFEYLSKYKPNILNVIEGYEK